MKRVTDKTTLQLILKIDILYLRDKKVAIT